MTSAVSLRCPAVKSRLTSLMNNVEGRLLINLPHESCRETIRVYSKSHDTTNKTGYRCYSMTLKITFTTSKILTIVIANHDLRKFTTSKTNAIRDARSRCLLCKFTTGILRVAIVTRCELPPYTSPMNAPGCLLRFTMAKTIATTKTIVSL